MLLPDFQARAAKAEELELEVQRLQRELQDKKGGWLAHFGAWFVGKS